MTDSAQKISRGLVRGTVAITINRVIDAVIGLLIVPFTLHRLGYDAYGLWALMYAITAYMNLADFGFSSSLNRHFSKALTSDDGEEKNHVLSTAFFTMLVMAISIMVIGLLLQYPILHFFGSKIDVGGVEKMVYEVMIWALSVAFMSNYFRSVMVAAQRADKLAVFQTTVTILNATMIYLVLSNDLGLIGLAQGTAAFAVVRIVIFFIGAKTTVKGWQIKPGLFRKDIFKTMWKFGLVVQLARITDMINMQFDRIIVGRLMNLETVSYYDVGAKAANTTTTISNILVYVIEPAAASLHTQGDHKRFEELIYRSGKYVALLTFPLVMFIIFNADILLNLWLSSTPHPLMKMALQFLVISYAMMSLTLTLRLAARGAGYPKWESKWLLVQAILNMTVSVGLFFLFEFKGILVGTLLAALFSQTMMTFNILSGLNLPKLPYVIRIWFYPASLSLCAGFISQYLAVFFIRGMENPGRMDVLPAVIAAIFIFIVVYGILIFVFKLINIAEIKNLVKRIR